MEPNQRGSILIMVIWFIAIIGVVVTFLFYRTEVEWAAVVNFENQSRYTRVAEAVLHERLALLVKDETAHDFPGDPWYGDDRVELEQDGFQITVVIEDEGSKPNLNTVSDNGLQRITAADLPSAVAPENQNPASGSEQNGQSPAASEDSQPAGQVSLDPLLDWRDRDGEQRAEGAELSYYQGLNPPYKPRDGCFSSLAEIKQVKGGDRLYPVLAPQVTLYGKINPNTISGETFSNLINSYGEFQKGWLDSVKDQFEDYRRSRRRFEKMNDFLQLTAINIGTLDKIKPLFRFSGACNVNMATKTGLTVILKEAGYDDAKVVAILNRRQAQPFEEIAEAYGLLGYRKAKDQVLPDDYLTTRSTIIRYRIWVSKGSSRYYLDTVWERRPASLKNEWQITPLSFRELRNEAVPEIPEVKNAKDSQDESAKSF
jgi:general secretion pathway protein K